jgi:hypothetical protein
MNKWAQVRRINARRLKARERAKRTWVRRHAARDRIAALDPILVGGKIVRRIVVIDDESRVRERSFYEFDRACDWKRKLREVLA